MNESYYILPNIRNIITRKKEFFYDMKNGLEFLTSHEIEVIRYNENTQTILCRISIVKYIGIIFLFSKIIFRIFFGI